jgi:hypothetical protein
VTAGAGYFQAGQSDAGASLASPGRDSDVLWLVSAPCPLLPALGPFTPSAHPCRQLWSMATAELSYKLPCMQSKHLWVGGAEE